MLLTDLLGEARDERDGDAVRTAGLSLDMPAYGAHLFDVRPRPAAAAAGGRRAA